MRMDLHNKPLAYSIFYALSTKYFQTNENLLCLLDKIWIGGVFYGRLYVRICKHAWLYVYRGTYWKAMN